MTQEDKELLLKDLSSRLPYGVKIYFGGIPKLLTSITIKLGYIEILVEGEYGKAAYCDSTYTYNNTEYLQEGITEECKPYLRSMSSMTEEEKRHISKMMCLRTYDDGVVHDMNYPVYTPYYVMDDCLSYLRSIHVDYSGLIEKGLALEAPEGIYK